MDITSLIPSSNFNFELCDRNSNLLSKGYTMPRTMKTGTTICGCIFEGGVVLAADTRATSGSTVLDKNCEKLHFLAPNMYCAGAGTAADTEHVTKNISIQLELLRLHTNRPSRVATAVTMLHDHLFKYGGHIGAYLIIAGLDVQGNHLVMISADGNFRHLPFATMGSGSLAAMSVMESKFKDHMTKEEAVQLVTEAIEAGITNDLGSGSNVDVVCIEPHGVDYRRNWRVYNKKAYQSAIRYDFPAGISPVINTYQLVVQDVAPMELE